MSDIFLKKLENNKNQYSLLFFLFSSLVLLPIIIFIHNDIYKVMAGIALVIHISITILYRKKGIASAAMYMVYYLLIVVGIILALILNFTLPLPSFMNKEVFSSIGILSVVIFTVVIPLPKHIREYIEDSLSDISIEKAKSIDLYIDKDTKKLVTYDTLIEFKFGLNYASMPYSLVNCSEIFLVLRKIIGYAFLGIGSIGLIVSLNSKDAAVSFINSWVFWTLIVSITLIIVGAAILFIGFIRALLVLILCGLTFVAAYYTYKFLKLSFQKSLLLFCCIIILIITGFIAGIYHLFKRIYTSIHLSFDYFENDEEVVMVDLTLNNACPVAGYDNIMEIEIQYDDKAIPDYIDNFNNELVYIAGRQRLIFAGAVFSFISKKYRLFIYTNNINKAEEVLSKFLNKNTAYPYKSNKTIDKKWEIYKKHLYPDEYTLIKSNNENIIDNLEEQGFDFLQEYPITFNLLFENYDKAIECKNDAPRNGFEKAIYIDNSETAKENELLKKYYHIVTLQITSKIGLDRLNVNCRKAMDFAALYSGELYDWELEELLDEEENIN